MTATTDFHQYVADQESASLFKKWANDNPGEYARWHAFRLLVEAGNAGAPPAMTTSEGKALIDAAVLTEHFQSVEAVQQQQPPASPPPVPAAALFDGRASLLSALASTGLATPTNTIQQTQTPKVWDGLTFTNNDISLIADDRWTKAYKIRTGKGSTNPWNILPPNKCAAEVSKIRPITPGMVDCYATSIKLQPGFTGADWGETHQLAYPSLSSPPLALDFNAVGLGVERNTGACTQTSSGWWQPAFAEDAGTTVFHKFADIIGKWVDVVIVVKWTFDATGFIHVLTRIEGEQGFTERLTRTNVITHQWHAGLPYPTSGLDKMGLYYGWYDASKVVQTNEMDCRGPERFASQADAVASLT